MNTEYKIQVSHIAKAFKMYNTPMDKMREALSISGKILHTDFYAITDLSFSVKKDYGKKRFREIDSFKDDNGYL